MRAEDEGVEAVGRCAKKSEAGGGVEEVEEEKPVAVVAVVVRAPELQLELELELEPGEENAGNDRNEGTSGGAGSGSW